ncbi:MAG: MmgE/PrpD family protein [Gemmatimonadota bacterium]
MTESQRLARFIVDAHWDDLSEHAVRELKVRLLDSLGCAIGALDAEPIRMLRAYLHDFGGRPLASLIGGGRTATDRAAFYNGALVRYLDYNDSFLAPGETCHPSDNLGAVLAAAEHADRSGRSLLAALGVAYQVHCRLSEEAPVRARGFDHTTQGAYAVAAGVAKALGLDERRTANAVRISGTANNALRVTRTGRLSHWKGLAYPNTAFQGTHATFLALHGITGPDEVFEGNKGFMDSIAGRFELDWEREGLDAVHRTILKKYNAEIHSQSALEGIIGYREERGADAEAIGRIEVELFDVAYHIIGGGEEGGKHEVHTKEEADHSLPYMLAVAYLDGEVGPAQYEPERIRRDDVQSLMRKVEVRPDEGFSARFPAEMPCRLTVERLDGDVEVIEKRDYEGFHTRPMAWETVVAKFDRLAAPHADEPLRREVVDVVAGLEKHRVRDLVRPLWRVGTEHT